LGFSPELQTPPSPAAHLEVGTGIGHSPELRHRHQNGPPISVATHRVRPRVAQLQMCCRSCPTDPNTFAVHPPLDSPRTTPHRDPTVTPPSTTTRPPPPPNTNPLRPRAGATLATTDRRLTNQAEFESHPSRDVAVSYCPCDRRTPSAYSALDGPDQGSSGSRTAADLRRSNHPPAFAEEAVIPGLRTPARYGARGADDPPASTGSALQSN
jgi:hypothetical protein